MKKYLLLFFMFFLILCSHAQTKNKEQKKYWAIDAGITYNYVDTKIYHFSNDFVYRNQTTPFPGYYSYPTITFHANFSKNIKLFRYFYLGGGIMYYNTKIKQYSPPDTIRKYFVFPDSIKENMSFVKANSPVHFIFNSNNIGLSFTPSFQYKRIILFFKLYFIIADINFYNNTYINGENKKYFNPYFFKATNESYSGAYGIQYKIFKNKNIYSYFIWNGSYLLGLEFRF